MNQTTIPQKPTGTVEERFARLQKEFPPDHVSVLPNLADDNTNREHAIESYLQTLERLEAFMKNGNSCEGLWFTYDKIRSYN